MIIDFCHSFKDYYEILDFYGIWDYSCPKCGAKHSLHRHAKYSRYLIRWEDGVFLNEEMDILRLRCTSCETTHAILTMDIIPFGIYSIQAVLALVSLCMQADSSVPKTEALTKVPYQLLYRFLQIFHQYREHLLSFLRLVGLWENDKPPMSRALLSALLSQPPPWPQSAFFKMFGSPLFLKRQNTVTYPLLFGCRLPYSPPPT